jgi:hypothetical protein
MSVLDLELRESVFQELKSDGFLQKSCAPRIPEVTEVEEKNENVRKEYLYEKRSYDDYNSMYL